MPLGYLKVNTLFRSEVIVFDDLPETQKKIPEVIVLDSSDEMENSPPVQETGSVFSVPDNLGVRSASSKKVSLETACSKCKYYEKMYNQAKIYYNAGALKLAKAEKLNRKSDRENKKIREDAKKY